MDPDITQLLHDARRGSKGAEAVLLEVIYEDLRKLARRHLRLERRDHTLQTSALVHEVYLKLFPSQRTDWESRGQFYAAAAKTMRRILVSYARARLAAKRPPRDGQVDAGDWKDALQSSPEEMLALDAALKELAEGDARQAQIVALRFFCGLSVEETASALGISDKTVKRDWSTARAWLRSRIAP